MRSVTKSARAKMKKTFLENFQECANIKSSAKGAGVDRTTIYRWKESDLKFRKEFDRALSIGIGALEDEAIRRAHDGVKRPVYHSGKVVGHVTEYSDTLLIFMLKSRKPEIYNRERLELSGPEGNPIPNEVTVRTIDLSKLTAEQLNALRLFKRTMDVPDQPPKSIPFASNEREVDDV